MATRFLISGGTSNWNSTSNWAATSGGVSGATFPVLGDDVICDGLSNANLTINTAGIICSSFSASPTYANTIKFSAATILSVAGNITLSSASTLNFIGNSGSFTVVSASTITSNNKPIGGLIINNGSTITLADNLSANTLFGVQNIATTTVINGNDLYLGGTVNHLNGNTISGTTNIIYNGTGLWSSGNNYIYNPFTINTLGTLVIQSASSIYIATSIAYSAGTIISSGSSGVNFNQVAGSTITVNTGSGCTFNNATIASVGAVPGVTYNLLRDLYLGTGTMTLGVGGPVVINNNKIYTQGSIATSNNVISSGTTEFVMLGIGSLTTASAAASIKNPITINSSGVTTISGTLQYNTGTFTHLSGTVITTSSTLSSAANTTFQTSGITWNNVTLAGTSQTYTLTSDLNASGTTTLGGTTSLTLNGFNLNTASLSATGPASGTTDIFITRTGTLQSSGAGLRNNLTINSTGTVTLGTLIYNTGTLTYSAGTIVPSTSTLTCTRGTTFQTSGMSWNNVTFSTNASNMTLNQPLNIGRLLQISVATTFDGNSGWNAAAFLCNTAGTNIGLKTGNTYNITSAMTISCTAASHITFSSSTLNSKAILTLYPGATQDVGFCNATDIDSSLGQTIKSRKGTLTRATNWSLLTAPTMVSTSF
jgi:hypothetical protein